MGKLLMRFEKWVRRGFNFIANVHFYWRVRKHTFRRARELARDTVYW